MSEQKPESRSPYLAATRILDRLVALVPDFAESWNGSDNYFLEEDGAFTCCGVFSEFSQYFRNHYEELSRHQISDIGQLVTEFVASSDAEERDAASTCFLENVAAERFHSEFRQHLSGEALRFYSIWNNPA